MRPKKKPSRANHKYRAEISKLIKLQALLKTTLTAKVEADTEAEYTRRKASLCKSYGISIQTLYRDMRKENPGKRKTRKDSGKSKSPLSKKQVLLINEAMHAGHTKKNAIKKTEEKTGERISTRKAGKLRPVPITDESSYGSEILKFILQICELDFIAPEAGLPVKFPGKKKFIVGHQELKDICLILATACDTGNDNRGFIDKGALVDNQLFYLLQEAIRITKEDYGSDTKRLESLISMRDKLRDKAASKVDINYHIAKRALRKVKKDITDEEALAVIRQAGEEQLKAAGGF